MQKNETVENAKSAEDIAVSRSVVLGIMDRDKIILEASTMRYERASETKSARLGHLIITFTRNFFGVRCNTN